jgi:secondary thiamine-phosphate synthase enzyme
MIKVLNIKTKNKDVVVDITEKINIHLSSFKKESQGSCLVFTAHTTCALTTADLDYGTDQDFLDALRGMLPKIKYRHPHDPKHAPDHILSSIIGPSINLPFKKNRLILGNWQRVVLVELNGPRKRKLFITCHTINHES